MENHQQQQSISNLNKLKNAIHSLFYEQTKERKTNQTIAVILISFNFLQIIATFYEKQTQYYFNDTLFPYIQGLSNAILVAPYLSDLYVPYLATTSLFFCVTIIFLVSIIYLTFHAYQNIKPFFTFPQKIFSLLGFAYQWILYFPGIQLFTMIYRCNGDNCWDGSRIGAAIAYSIGLIILIGIGFLMFTFNTISQSLSQDAFSRVDSSIEIFLFAFETLISIITQFTNSTSYRYIGLIIHVVGSFVLMKVYFDYIPYYHETTSYVFGGCCTSYFWVTFNVCITEILRSQHYGGQSIVIIIGIIVIFPLTKNIRERIFLQKVFEKRHDKIKSPYEIELYIRQLRSLLSTRQGDSFSEMVLLGYITNHKSECSNPECPINTNEKLYLPLSNSYSNINQQNDLIYTIYVIESIFNEFSHSVNSNALFHYIYSDFLLNVVGNLHMALIELFMAEKNDPGIQLEYSIFKIKRKIENELNEMNSKRKKSSKQSLLLIDATVVIEYEELFKVFQKKVEKLTGEYMEFWQMLDSIVTDLNLINIKGHKILKNTISLKSLWEGMHKINPSYHKALWLYGFFMSEIKNDKREGGQMIEKARQLKLNKLLEKTMSDFDTMFSEDTSLIIISGEKESQGVIRQVSIGTFTLLGYKNYDLIGHNVSIVMPSIIGNHHSSYLQSYFKTGKQKMIGNDNHSFAINKQGNLLPISLIVKPVPSLKNGIQYIGVLRQINKEYEYILLHSDGLINSVSRGAQSLLSPVCPSMLHQFDIYVQLICPDLLDYINDRTTTKYEVYKGNKKLTFMIPKEFANILVQTGKDTDFDRRSEMECSVDQQDKQTLAARLISKFQNITMQSDGNKVSKNYLKQKINYAVSKKITMEVDISTIEYSNVSFKLFKIISNGKRGSISSDEPTDNLQSIWMSDGTRAVKNIGAVSQALSRMSAALHDQSSNQPESDSIERKVKDSIEESKDLPPPIMPLNLRQDGNNESIVSLMNVITFQKTETTSESRSIDQSRPSNQKLRSPEFKSDIRREPTTTTLYLNAKDDLNKKGIGGEKPFMPEFTTITTISQNFHEDSMIDIGLLEKNKEKKEKRSKRGSKKGSKKDINLQHNKNARIETIVESSLDISAAPINRCSTNGAGSVSSIEEEDEEGFFVNLKKNFDKKGTFNTEDGNSSNDRKANSGFQKEDDQNTEGSMNSSNDASSTKSVMRQLKDLTKSMYTSVMPSSVRNLQILSYIIFFVITIATFVNYFVGRGLYQELEGNVDIIKSAQIREISTIYISSSTRELYLENIGLLNIASRGDLFSNVSFQTDSAQNYHQWLTQTLWEYSCSLRSSQAAIGMMPDSSDEVINSNINSNSVILNYGNQSMLDIVHETDSWTALMAVVLHTQNIFSNGFTDATEESVNFIQTNTLNGIMLKINRTIEALSQKNIMTADKGKRVLLILLVVSSIITIGTLAILIPMIYIIGYSVEEVLMLFLQINLRKVKEEFKKCRKFFMAFKGDYEKLEEDNINAQEVRQTAVCKKTGNAELNPNKHQDIPIHASTSLLPIVDNAIEKKEEDKKEKEDAKKKIEEDIDVKKELLDIDEGDIESTHRRRKYKKYTRNFGRNVAKFIVSMIIIESYFIFAYFKSTLFYDDIVGIIEELSILNNRIFTNAYLQIAEFEMISTNGSAQIQLMPSTEFVSNYISTVILEQEHFLSAHSSNFARNQKQYNENFDNIVYKNVCNQISVDQEDSCPTFLGGILQKGLHSANVAYWDMIRELLTQFKKGVEISVNDKSLIDVKLLESKYLEPAYKMLDAMLESSIHSIFYNENFLLLLVFVGFLGVVILIFMVTWRAFIYYTRKSLFMTKSMITIIPPEIIFQTRRIRDFVIKSSSRVVYQYK